METRITCEIASSHNADLELAKALIRAAAKNGADACKFQSWDAKNVADEDPDKRRYEHYQFPDSWYGELIPFCKEQGVEFYTSIFNADKCAYLASLGIRKAKISSVSMTNKELLLQAGLHFEELIVSTGAHSLEEIEETIDWLATNARKFTLMVCTVNYPTLPADANIGRILQLKKLLEDYEYADVGFSSHALDLDVPKAALAMGIKDLEVHFSLSRFLPQKFHTMYEGGDLLTTHAVSLEPHELRDLADWRDKMSLIGGDGEFSINGVEMKIKERYSERYGR